MEDRADQWYPIAATSDLPFRHIFQTELLGHEMVAWRADDGFVNVWRNRCLHRGSRLSIGVNDGAELVCAYHGWRYANRTAGCTYIPAHPSDSPPRTVCNRVYPSVERHGLIWTGLGPQVDPPDLKGLTEEGQLVLRSLPIHAPLDDVGSLLKDYDFDVFGDNDQELPRFDLVSHSDDRFWFRSIEPAETVSMLLMMQPVNSAKTIVHSVLVPAPEEAHRLGALHYYNHQLTRFCEKVEAGIPPRTHAGPEDFQRPSEGASVAASVVVGELEVRVAKKWKTAIDSVGLELRAVERELPTFQPGAHIDLHLANGLVRQYSLVNGPGEQDRYVIGVKLEQESRGGSRFLHEDIREGDTLAIAGPHSNFPLRRDAPRTLLLAGGIGVTPLLSMAQALARAGLDYQLHYFVQSEDHLAFPERIERLGSQVLTHIGMGPAETVRLVEELLGTYDSLSQVYTCGPPAMIGEVRSTASNLGWPLETIHYEYFKNETVVDALSAFEIDLARSGMTLFVEGGKTILEVLRENGVTLPSSCEQGACGTCEVAVLEGLPHHQDVYLNESEHAAGDRIMTCISRAHSERLVLDI